MANKKVTKKLNKLIDLSREHLDDGENAVQVVMGAYEAKALGTEIVRTGIFIATETRLVFLQKRHSDSSWNLFPIVESRQ